MLEKIKNATKNVDFTFVVSDNMSECVCTMFIAVPYRTRLLALSVTSNTDSGGEKCPGRLVALLSRNSDERPWAVSHEQSVDTIRRPAQLLYYRRDEQ